MEYTAYEINIRYHNYTQSTLSTLRTYFLTTQNKYSAQQYYYTRLYISQQETVRGKSRTVNHVKNVR